MNNVFKNLLAASVLLVASVASAAIEPLTAEEEKLLASRYDKLTPEQKKVRDNAARKRALIEEGGVLTVPGTPKGTIRYINLQTRVATNDLQRALRIFSSSMMTYDAKIVGADCEASIKIRIIDDPNAPRLLVAPDDFTASVNVAKLVQDNPKPAFLAARTRKEMIRAFTFLTAGSGHGRELYGPIRKLSDFDTIVEKGLPFDIQARAKQFLKAMGVEAEEKSTYRQLLESGYMLKPQDEYQKAIYDKFMSEKERGPVNGIKIAPPKAEKRK